MFFLLLFVGIYFFLSGLLFLLDTVVWNIETGANFIEYGINYAETRHYFYAHETVYATLVVIAGIVFLVLSLIHIKKCKHCNRYILKNQNFCHNCGNKLKRM